MNAQHHSGTRSEQPPEVLILGGGRCASRIAANLGRQGIVTHLVSGSDASPQTADPHRTEVLSAAELIRCDGFAGDFDLHFVCRQSRHTRNASAIVVAEEDNAVANAAAYGLTPAERVIAISALEAKLEAFSTADLFGERARIVFVCGWQTDSHPVVARRMLDACIRLQQTPGIRTCFTTGNLKVAPTGSEEAVLAAKRAGALFYKFTHDYPSIPNQAEGRFELHCFDEATRTPLVIEADWIVVDETMHPAPTLGSVARRLGLEQDNAGFAQADNVRRLNNATNRRGIFVAGGARGILSEAEKMADADQVSLQVIAFLDQTASGDRSPAAIEQGRCARCLTCYRLCPHQAVAIGTHISVVPEACQSCGICVAGCPGQAIEMVGVPIDAEIDRQRPTAGAADAAAPPRILVFGCARSAGVARDAARQAGNDLPDGVQFIEVPCGGSVAVRHLLAAFEAGAQGVMLCTCHSGNCQAEIGNQVARMRAAEAQNLLSAAGLAAEQLCIVSVAANMGDELADMVVGFVDEITSMNDPSKERQHG